MTYQSEGGELGHMPSYTYKDIDIDIHQFMSMDYVMTSYID